MEKIEDEEFLKTKIKQLNSVAEMKLLNYDIFKAINLANEFEMEKAEYIQMIDSDEYTVFNNERVRVLIKIDEDIKSLNKKLFNFELSTEKYVEALIKLLEE